ncbi:(Na+)-NQR maturation NqrM [Marinibactrum halimedae]|uniref:(Na+)-NQR maturation NqrM n=1 Tax=Marinibactrum halimedae TaxID=1444977 RepID=A0AA37WR76_9GAMM|nr:(Na+)-NQR maturation NqrM [Marinibactrum halimedae]MCD9459478.1 (Na+)-NQR maturation NqrM [Marinibactrum halimedae]GLS28132.1 hypothetical protein GCM10007877_38510 [Marinibactrum halimedae]
MTFLIAFIVLALLIGGMAIGVIMGRKPLAGSCGGVGKALGEDDYVCELCGGDEQKCEEQKLQGNTKDRVQSAHSTAPEALAYDASQSK